MDRTRPEPDRPACRGSNSRPVAWLVASGARPARSHTDRPRKLRRPARRVPDRRAPQARWTGRRVGAASGRSASPLARRSAALPARPAPSDPRLARKSGACPVDRLAAAPAPAAPAAHGGGAAQSRGGLRRAGGSSGSYGASPSLGDPPGSTAPVVLGDLVLAVRRIVVGAGASEGDGRIPAIELGRGDSGAGHPGTRATGRCRRSCLGSLAARPRLEGRTDRERAREAVRLLVSKGARRGTDLGVATVRVVGLARPFITFVLVRDEGTGRGAIHGGPFTVGHPGDDTRRHRTGHPQATRALSATGSMRHASIGADPARQEDPTMVRDGHR